MIVQESEFQELHARIEKAELECLRLTRENEQLKLKARLTELGDKEVAHTEEMIRLADELAYTKNELRQEQSEHDSTKRLQKLTRDEVNRKQAEIDEFRDPSKLDVQLQRLYAQLGAAGEREAQLHEKLRARAIELESYSRLPAPARKKLQQREETMAKKLEKDLLAAEADVFYDESTYFRRLAADLKEPNR